MGLRHHQIEGVKFLIVNERAKAWARKNPEKMRESVKKYTEKHADYRREKAKEYKASNPDVVRAHELVRNAVRSGRLVKPKFCSNCIKETRLHGHHEDYSKPLEVVWLCQACHWWVHNGTF